MVQVERVGGRLVRARTTSPQTLQQKLQVRRTQLIERKKREQAIVTEVNRLNTEFERVNFGGSVQEFNRQYNSIKAQNPEVAARLKFNPQTIQTELNKRIKSIESSLQSSRKSEQRARDKDDDPRLERERARQKGLSEGLQRLKTGELLTVNSITKFAGDLGSQAYSEERARERRREVKRKARVKLPSKGKVTATTIKIGGKVIVGFKDSRGNFSPSGKGDNAAVFNQVQKAFGTKNVSKIEEIKKIPQVATELKAAKTQAIKTELVRTQKIVRDAQLAVKNAALLKRFDKEVQKNRSLLTSTIDKRDKFIKDRTEKGKPFFIDPNLQLDLFKLEVNQASRDLNLKPIPFTAPLSKFETQANKINSKIKQFEKVKSKLTPTENKELAKLIKPTEQQQLRNLVVTGQSMTPKQIARFNEIQLFEGKKLNKRQWNNFKTATLIVPAFIYGKNLRKRGERGERNPFFADIKEVRREFVKATYGLGKEIGEFLGKGVRRVLGSSYDYGVRITKEAQKGNFVLDNDIKKLGTSIFRGANSVADATTKVAKFVRENPTASAVIVTVAAAKLGTSLKAKFIKDPVETTIGALLIVGTPLKIPKAIKEAYVKFTPRGVQLPFQDAVQFTDYKKIGKLQGTKQDLFHISPAKIETFFAKKGIGRQDFIKVTPGTGAGIERQFYWAREKINLAPFESAFKKATTTKAKSKVVNSLRKRIGVKFNLTPKQINQRIKQLGEFAFYAAPGRVYTTFGNTTLIKFENTIINRFPKSIQSRINNIPNLTVKQRTKLRTDMNRYINANKNKFFVGPKTASGLGPELEVVAAAGSEFKARKTLTTQVFRFFGITKGSKVAYLPTVDAFIQVAEVTFKQQKIKTNKAFMKRFINFFSETLEKIKNGAKIRPKDLKKAIIQFIKDKKISRPTKTTTTPKKKLTNKQKSAIKKKRESLEKDFIRRKGIKVTKRKPKLRRVPKKVKRVPTPKRVPKKVTRAPKPVRAPKKVKRVPTPKRVPKKITRAPPKVKRVPKPVRAPPKTVRVPRPVKVPPITTRGPPKLTPDFDSRKYKDRIIILNGLYRERKNRSMPTSKRNPVVTKTLKLKTTRNRALKQIADLADRRTVRSITTKIVGVTDKKMKDIKLPVVLKKFNKKKSKNTPVLKLVEKTKFISDTRGEKIELKKTRRRKAKPKPKKKTKTIKKRKTKK